MRIHNLFVALLLTLQACAAAPRAAQAGGHAAGAAPSEPASYVFQRQASIIQAMALDYGVTDVEVVWSPCGEENSYYYPGLEPRIVLCTEMSEHPGAAIVFAAHEMGHAVTDALADITDENAADEVAILAMVKHGYQQEMLDGAIYYLEAGWPLEHMKGDEHPGTAYRAWEFACAEAGSEGGPDECVHLYYGLKIKWGRRLLPLPLY